MTVRIDRALLAELKRAARADGRSASSQVVHLLKKELRPLAQSPAGPHRSAAGAFAHADVAERVMDYRLGPWLEGAFDRRERRQRERRRP
jgi:hypothetical protein